MPGGQAVWRGGVKFCRGTILCAPEETTRSCIDAFPNARFQVIEGAGHFSFEEQPAIFAEMVFNRQRQFTADASHELSTPLTIIELEANRALERLRSPNVLSCIPVFSMRFRFGLTVIT